MTTCAYLDLGTITCTTCNPFTYKHSCGAELNIPEFKIYPDGTMGETVKCTCGKVLDLFVTGREIRVLQRLVHHKEDQ